MYTTELKIKKQEAYQENPGKLQATLTITSGNMRQDLTLPDTFILEVFQLIVPHLYQTIGGTSLHFLQLVEEFSRQAEGK